MNSQRWFQKHQAHGIEEREVAGAPAGTLKNYVCRQCRKGLITTEKPGDPVINGGDLFGGMGGRPNGTG